LKNIVKTMEANNYSHVPVYNRAWEFVWLLSESNILSRLAEDDLHDLSSAKVWDIKLINSKNYVYFISSMVNVYEVDKLFADKKENWEKIWILLITENGKMNEPIIGIISAGDTALIDSYVVH
jgi:predicted transcriptional regulator